MRRRLIVLILAVCAMLLATGGAVATTGAERFVMGTHGPNDLRGGSGADLLASEGAWGAYPEDTALDTVHGAGGNDFIDTVNDPPSRDLVHCPGWDEVQADPEDYVNEDCEKVQRIDLSQGPQPPKERPSTCRPRQERLSLFTPLLARAFSEVCQKRG